MKKKKSNQKRSTAYAKKKKSFAKRYGKFDCRVKSVDENLRPN